MGGRLHKTCYLGGEEGIERLAVGVVRVSITGAQRRTVEIYEKQRELIDSEDGKIIQKELPEKLAVSFTCDSARNAENLRQHFLNPRNVRYVGRRRLMSHRLRASAKRAEATSVSDQLRNQF